MPLCSEPVFDKLVYQHEGLALLRLRLLGGKGSVQDDRRIVNACSSHLDTPTVKAVLGIVQRTLYGPFVDS